MDYYNKILILKKYYKQQINNNDLKQANSSLLQIKNLHGKVIEHILMLKESNEDNKLELLSDLERINFKIITIIDDCEDNIDSKPDKQIEDKYINVKPDEDEDEEPSKINKNLPFCVLFYADWCGHCKNFMPTWNSLTESLPSDKINMIKISCVDKEQQCNAIDDIKGYPTIIYVDIKLKKKIIFSGQRTYDSIINFINESNGKKIV
jgi:thiol-disulfide isomerase/thioredoxin